MTSTSADREIERLEAENAGLRARIADLEARLTSQPTGPTVRTIVPRIEVPTDQQMRQLHDIAVAKWPSTAGRNESESLARFAVAFKYLATSCSHSDKRSPYAYSVWIDRVEDFARAIGIRIDGMSWGAICAAACVLGFKHSAFEGTPTAWDVWAGIGSHRLPGSAHWRGLLAGNPLPEPVEVQQKRWDPTAGRARISGGDQRVGQHRGWVETW